jgi:RNA polymerase primary sigma factor
MSPKKSKGKEDLFQLGKQKGFVSLDDIVFHSPVSQSNEEMAELLTELAEDGVDIVGVESVAEEAPAKPTPTPKVVTEAADPVTIYMRQLKLVPLLTREAEVETAKRLEDARLDVVRIALGTAIAIDEMIQLSRQLKASKPDPLDIDQEGISEEGEESGELGARERFSDQVSQLQHLEEEILKLEGEGLDSPPQDDASTDAQDERQQVLRQEMLDILRELPFRETYIKRVVVRIKEMAARLEEAQEEIRTIEAANAEAGENEAQEELLRKQRNALRRIRGLKRRSQTSESRLEQVHREILAAEAKAQRAKDELVLANQRLVVHIAGKYVNRGLPFLELVQEGNLGLMRAVDKFDYRRGYKFSTYGTWWIRHAISRAIANQSRTIRLPVHIRDEIRRLVSESQRHVMEFGREPTTEELAQRLKIPVERVVEVMEASRKTLRWELPVGEDGETELGTLISDKEAPSPFDEVSSKGQWERIMKAMETLREREMEVVKRRFGLDGQIPQTLEQVGQELGITRERVRQIQAQAIRKIQVAVRAADRVPRI